MTAGVPLDSIVVGERLDPARADRRIAELAESIRAHGLFFPLLVTPERHLLDGRRRVAALRLLEQQGVTVPVLIRVLATAKEQLEQLDVEWEANAQREPPTVEAQVRYAQRRLELERAMAAERRTEGARRGGHAKALAASGPAGPGASEAGAEDDRAPTRAEAEAARAAGMSRSTFRRAAEVLAAVEADPSLEPLRDELNATGKVAAVHRKLQRAQAAGALHDPDSYCTQRWLLEGIHAVEPGGITLDPCSNELARRLGFVRAAVSWTIDDDARAQPTWRVVEVNGRYIVFFQPPYSSPDTGDKAKGLPGLTTRLCLAWDGGEADRVYALVKDDASTDWWGLLRDRAALLVKPRDRLAHVVGVDDDGHEIEHGGSDFNSAMLVLARGSRGELLDLWTGLAEAYEGRADVYLAPSVRRAPAGPRRAPTAEPTTVLSALESARTALDQARHLARHPAAGVEDIGSPQDNAIGEALRAVNVAARFSTHPPRKPR